MTDWTTIPDSSVDEGSPIDVTLMEALRDNPAAIAEGAVGAPRIQEAAIEDGAITRSKLNTATGSASGTVAANGTENINFNGYAFFPVLQTDSDGEGNVVLGALDYTPASVQDVRFAIVNRDGSNSHTYSVQWRYVTTS